MLQSRSFVRIGHKCKYKEHQTSWVYENHTSKQLWNKSHKHPPTLDEQEKVFTDYDFYFRTPVYNAWIASIQHRAFLPSILNKKNILAFLFCSESCALCSPLRTFVQFAILYNVAVIEYETHSNSTVLCAWRNKVCLKEIFRSCNEIYWKKSAVCWFFFSSHFPHTIIPWNTDIIHSSVEM